MPLAKVLVCLDTDLQPSVFDAVVAVDAGADHVLRHGGVTPESIRGLVTAYKFVSNVVAAGNSVVFVGTKRQARQTVREEAIRCGMPYVTERWLGGTLTNFRTIRSQLQRLQQLEAMQADGALDRESKKQASRLKREMRKIQSNLDGTESSKPFFNSSRWAVSFSVTKKYVRSFS